MRDVCRKRRQGREDGAGAGAGIGVGMWGFLRVFDITPFLHPSFLVPFSQTPLAALLYIHLGINKQDNQRHVVHICIV